MIFNKHQQLKELELHTEYLELDPSEFEVNDKAFGDKLDSENLAEILIEANPSDNSVNQSDSLNDFYVNIEALDEAAGFVDSASMVTRSKRSVQLFIFVFVIFHTLINFQENFHRKTAI